MNCNNFYSIQHRNKGASCQLFSKQRFAGGGGVGILMSSYSPVGSQQASHKKKNSLNRFTFSRFSNQRGTRTCRNCILRMFSACVNLKRQFSFKIAKHIGRCCGTKEEQTKNVLFKYKFKLQKVDKIKTKYSLCIFRELKGSVTFEISKVSECF